MTHTTTKMEGWLTKFASKHQFCIKWKNGMLLFGPDYMLQRPVAVALMWNDRRVLDPHTELLLGDSIYFDKVEFGWPTMKSFTKKRRRNR